MNLENKMAGHPGFSKITEYLIEYLKENGIDRIITRGNGLTYSYMTIPLKDDVLFAWAEIEVFDDANYKVIASRRDNKSFITGSIYDPESFPAILEFIKKHYEN